MINVIKAPIEKVHDVHKQIGILMETTKNSQVETLEMKNTATEMKNVFNRVICRLNTTKERISKLEDRPTEITQIEIQEVNKEEKNQNQKQKQRREHFVLQDIIGLNMNVIQDLTGEERGNRPPPQNKTKQQQNIEEILSEQFPKIMKNTKLNFQKNSKNIKLENIFFSTKLKPRGITFNC